MPRQDRAGGWAEEAGGVEFVDRAEQVGVRVVSGALRGGGTWTRDPTGSRIGGRGGPAPTGSRAVVERRGQGAGDGGVFAVVHPGQRELVEEIGIAVGERRVAGDCRRIQSAADVVDQAMEEALGFLRCERVQLVDDEVAGTGMERVGRGEWRGRRE